MSLYLFISLSLIIAKNTAIIVLMVIFSAGNPAVEQRIHFSGQKHSKNRRDKIDPEGVPKMGENGTPKSTGGVHAHA